MIAVAAAAAVIAGVATLATDRPPASTSPAAGPTFPITIDARQLSAATFGISDRGGQLDRGAAQVVQLPAGVFRVGSESSAVTFTVSPAGVVGYDPSVALVVSGAATSTLTLLGAPVTIDATALSNARYDLTLETSSLVNDAPHTLRLLPGTHGFQIRECRFPFVVNLDGTVSYDNHLGNFLAGAGTTTLTVRGFPITVNALALGGEFGFSLLDETGVFLNKAPQAMRVLPGPHAIHQAAVTIPFQVDANGAIGYDPADAWRLSGAGTTTLTVTRS